ncbi:Na+/H+ antiporter NhaC family protein [Hoyosella subflava]|uniref:Na+/H+ antiporter NhaC n=1 Tax=Hoyosella subflava (strain DSM 45089 / JCM 17490 / NBRC 109087 / DQS3-9A1) TaxID=443218 RepID=F6ES10_HOYSD|nr:Na+/H+ antiporter NhaC family protein [Hoyosella subflava]AEF40825.1 Na+/H+ antiporter NhaC [Hoyosella subflava DQS3-9A1]
MSETKYPASSTPPFGTQKSGSARTRRRTLVVATVVVVAILGLLLYQTMDTGSAVDGSSTAATGRWWSLLPPVVAISLALLTRQILPALFAGVWLGAWLAEGLSAWGLVTSLLDSAGVYVVDAIAEPDHVMIIAFTLMIGGLVGILRKNGGTDGIVRIVTRWASTPRRGQVATGGLGVAIFFDDYANTLVVGNTMRPVMDRLRVSREKLAYIVDSTAAPIATLALLSTWIGFQVVLIDDAIAGTDLTANGFAVFVESLKYAFYPILALALVFAIALSGRDFGPMLQAERRARTTGAVSREGADIGLGGVEDELTPHEGAPRRLVNALLPILVLVGTTVAGLFATGEGASIIEIVGDGDPFSSLLWGALLAILVAAALSMSQGILTIADVVAAWFAGVKSVLYVVIILVLAWALAALTGILGTAEFLAGALGTALPLFLLPAVLFVVAGAVAFSTGTSWGTMGILTPLAVPVAWAVLDARGLADAAGHPILFASVSTILAGAVLGDHCSPISDTTVISSLASQCDVIDHVRTQLPYALFVGAVVIVFGLVPVGLGLPWWAAMALCGLVVVGGLMVAGRRSDAVEAPGFGPPPAPEAREVIG